MFFFFEFFWVSISSCPSLTIMYVDIPFWTLGGNISRFCLSPIITIILYYLGGELDGEGSLIDHV